MLLPIAMMAFVENLRAGALDLSVSATVPALIPTEAPVITSPTNNIKVASQNVQIKGTCPVVTPAIIVVIYEKATLRGSTQCTAGGTFSVVATFGYGKHTIVATVMTITDDEGQTSAPVMFTRPMPAKSPSLSTNQISNPHLLPQVISTQNFVPLQSNGRVVLKFKIITGELPYIVSIEWGDGTKNTYSISDRKEHAYTHTYSATRTYDISIEIRDNAGQTAELQTVAVTYLLPNGFGLGLDSHYNQVPPFVAFIQQHIWQIYIGVFSTLVFLWYLEHGRHLHRHKFGKFHLFHR